MNNKKQRGLFDEEFRLEKLTNQKDPLVKLGEVINWEIFRPILDKIFQKKKKVKAGRPAYDYVMMFKILVLQRLYNLSDDQMEFQILDRLTFMRFLGLHLGDRIPDSKTIWLFREQLTQAGRVEELFEQFNAMIEQEGLIAHEGKMVDASFVEVPRQRNSREENQQIKEREVPQQWEANAHKLSQKDTDARWTKKNGVSYYGYKNHVKADVKSKLITKYHVTDASIHDSQAVEQLVDDHDKDQDLYADSAYSGEPIAATLSRNKIKNRVHEKGYKNKPLTEQQKQANKEKSKIRARVEHIFGFIENSMKRSYIRSIGITRASAIIGLMNLTYNMFRYIQLSNING